MPRVKSAGVLMYRRSGSSLEVLLVHPGGPFWHRKDDAAWTIPKGEFGDDEAAENAARREFHEETAHVLTAPLIALSPVKQKSGKLVYPFATEGDLDPSTVRSNTFRLEWPAGSGSMREFPEVDRARWFTLEEAERKLIPAQRPMLAELKRLLGADE